MSQKQEEQGRPAESIGWLFLMGAGTLIRGFVRKALAAAMGLALGGWVLGATAALVSAGVVTSLLPHLMLVGWLAHGELWNQDKALMFALAGFASWLSLPLIMSACAWVDRRSPPAGPLSAGAQSAINAASSPWLAGQARLWHDSMSRMTQKVDEALDGAVQSGGAFKEMMSLALWLAPTPLIIGALCVGVGPWTTATVAMSLAGRVLRGIKKLAGFKSSWGSVSGLGVNGGAPTQSGWTEAGARIIQAARRWAGQKAIEVAKVGAGSAAAARAQRAALEKEARKAPSGGQGGRGPRL